MARDSRPITGRGFQILLSRSFAEEAFPFISAPGVLVPIRKKCADVPTLKFGSLRKKQEHFDLKPGQHFVFTAIDPPGCWRP
jgi:hypothetical protein